MRSLQVLLAVALFAVAARAQRAPILIQSDISTSTTWTADNQYLLSGQIYVLPGATLTIEAGAVVFSNSALLGRLAVTRGGQIDVQGTVSDPVIFTFSADIATWASQPAHPTGGDPTTGSWIEEADGGAGLALLGSAYIAGSGFFGSGVPRPDPANQGIVSGLVATGPNDPRPRFGGGDDLDDSGSVSYLSMRYAGRVIGLRNAIGALTLAGVGSGTDIHHVEVMNSRSDGVRIWGGTVSARYLSVWNAGDECVDIDFGWRGRMQYLLAVQGYSIDAPRGDGVGDHGFSIFGALPSDSQPVTTGLIYNATYIGQRGLGHRGIEFAANARMQIRNSIFMDAGDQLLASIVPTPFIPSGYGVGGNPGFNATFATPSTQRPQSNPAPAGLTGFAGYPAQIGGTLLEFSDSVLYRNLNYSVAIQAGVVDPTLGPMNLNDNVLEPSVAPIRSLTRAPAVIRGGNVQERVIQLDPRAVNEATTSVRFAPDVEGLTSSRYRGTVAPESSWLNGWTAADAFGFLASDAFTDLGGGVAGALGAPRLGAESDLQPGSPVTITLANCPPTGSSAVLFVGSPASQPLGLFGLDLMVDLNGAIQVPLIPNTRRVFNPPPLPVGSELDFQAVVLDPSRRPDPLTTTNRLRGFWR